MKSYPLSKKKKPLTPKIARKVGIGFLQLCRSWSIVSSPVNEPTWVNKPAPPVKPPGSRTKGGSNTEGIHMKWEGKKRRTGYEQNTLHMKLSNTTTVSKKWVYVYSTETVDREISNCFSSHPLPQGTDNVPRATGWCVYSLFLECNRYEIETGGCYKLLEFKRPVILIPLFPTWMIKEGVSATTRRHLMLKA